MSAPEYPLWESLGWLEQHSILAARQDEINVWEAGFLTEGNGAAMNIDLDD